MSLTAIQASAYTHHLHLASPDPERLARFYADTMDMRAERQVDGWHVRGPGRRLQISEGPAGKLLHAGFGLRDADGLVGLRARAQENGLAPQDFATSFFAPGAFSVADPDGNLIAFGLGSEDPASPPRTLRGPLQHLTLASRDVQAIEDFYHGKLGFGLSDRVLDPQGRMMTCFMRGNHEHHNIACFLHKDRQGVDHHSYEAGEWDTIRDWCDHLAARDIQIMWGPGRHGPGNNLFVFIVDPDGNWIEISAEIEVVHSRPMQVWPHGERTLNLWGRAILRA
jgi:catechol 2,3-dioxygenase-like lactoylglutathione lyase family enzyme